MKTCSRCKIEKDDAEYHKSSRMKDGLQSSCKSCMAESYIRSRLAKLDHYKSVQKKRIRSNMDKFQEWKREQRCCKCGEDETCCLDLHHLDPNEKEIDVSNASSYWSWERLKTEIDKCIVVCSNCHRKIHAGVISV